MDEGGTLSKKNGWHTEWQCTVRDLERLEELDLQPLRDQRSAWLLADSRQSVWNDDPAPKVYSRKYCIFLASGLWWAVPSVTLRLDYDYRTGTGRIDMRTRDFEKLWDCYFPNGHTGSTESVEGLQKILYPASTARPGV